MALSPSLRDRVFSWVADDPELETAKEALALVAAGNEAELADFLRRNAVLPTADGLAGYDMDEGVPDGFDAAVVPIVCR